MQIFVKGLDGKTKTIDGVDANTTIAEVIHKFSVKAGVKVPIRLIYQSKITQELSTLGALEIKEASTLHAALKPQPRKYDPNAKFALRRRLEVLAGKRCCVFIGIGSFDHNHGHASVRQQQCPEWIKRECQKRRLQLNVILVDPGFAQLPQVGHTPQIYDIDNEWKVQHRIFNDRVRHFKGGGTSKLSTYATFTDAEEYGGDRHTLADVDLDKVADSIETAGGIFVSGNFYSATAKPHICKGVGSGGGTGVESKRESKNIG